MAPNFLTAALETRQWINSFRILREIIFDPEFPIRLSSGYQPRKKNMWDSGNRESNTGEKQKKNLR